MVNVAHLVEPRCLTFETASKGPFTLRMRSGFPGMLSDTMTLAPLFSRISLTCFPPLPIMIDASCVTIRQRICIIAEGGVVELEEEEFAAALSVVDLASVADAAAVSAESPGATTAVGVDAAVSSAL